MVYIDRRTGHCREARCAPGQDYEPVPGRGALHRRRRGERWQAAHAFAPDSPLWIAQGWERVRFQAAEPPETTQTGTRSGLSFAFAPLTTSEGRSVREPSVWVVLPEEAGYQAPAGRPGAQAVFALEDLSEGLSPATIAERLLTARIVDLGLALDSALWVLKGPPVAPSDSRILRRLSPVLALAGRLSDDLQAAVQVHGGLRPPVPPGPARRSRPDRGRRSSHIRGRASRRPAATTRRAG